MTLASRPDDEWLRIYDRDVPVEVLSAVVDGEVVFATVAGAAVARAAVTKGPDGTRWVGLSALQVADGSAPPRPRTIPVHRTVLSWGADHGAQRAYTQVLDDNYSATALFESMGFTLHHRSRYVRADTVQNGGGW